MSMESFNFKHVEKCIENLKRNEFDVHFFKKSEQAKFFILDIVKDYKILGFPGSRTVRDLNLIKKLDTKGRVLLDHWKKSLTEREIEKIKLYQGRSDCLICSANAITSTGEIVNIDGYGNRVAGTIIGPKKVIIVAGVSKITPNLDMAFQRIKTIAGPIRAKEVGVKTPCVKTGVCEDCNSSERICRITVIMHRKPLKTDIIVVLINEALGI